MAGASPTLPSPMPAIDLPESLIPDSVLLKQVEARMENPARIDQGYTNLCGMACCAMTMAKYDPEGYKAFMIELNHNGEAQYKQYHLKVSRRIAHMEKNYFRRGKLPASDWILLASMRNKGHLIFPYGGRMLEPYERWMGSNTPAAMRRILKRMELEKTTDNMNGIWPIRKPALESLQQLDSAFKEGHTPIILINTRMYQKGKFSFMSNHFVIFNGKYTYNAETNEVSFNVWTYGYSSGKTIHCTPEAFRNNYFGHILVKKK